jgi:hypothetical protein
MPTQSLLTSENCAGKKSSEARDRGGIFGDASRFPPTETVHPASPGGKAAESQRLFRRHQETAIVQDWMAHSRRHERLGEPEHLMLTRPSDRRIGAVPAPRYGKRKAAKPQGKPARARGNSKQANVIALLKRP